MAAEKEQLAKDQVEMKQQQLLDKIAFMETSGYQIKVLETKILLADAYEIKIAAERKTVQANTVDNLTKAAEFFAVGAKTQTELVGKLVGWNAQSTQTAVCETVSYAHNIVVAQQSQQAESQRQQHQQQAEDQKQLADLIMKQQAEEQKSAIEAKRRKENKRKAAEAEVEAAKKQWQMLQDKLLIVDDDSNVLLEKQY